MDATSLPNLSDYNRISQFVEHYGAERVREILDEQSKLQPVQTPVKSPVKSVKPAFAEDPAFDWGRLGHFNKSAFLLEQIKLCKTMNDRVKAYELQRQLSGLSARDTLLKYSGKCVTISFMQSCFRL